MRSVRLHPLRDQNISVWDTFAVLHARRLKVNIPRARWHSLAVFFLGKKMQKGQTCFFGCLFKGPLPVYKGHVNYTLYCWEKQLTDYFNAEIHVLSHGFSSSWCGQCDRARKPTLETRKQRQTDCTQSDPSSFSLVLLCLYQVLFPWEGWGVILKDVLFNNHICFHCFDPYRPSWQHAKGLHHADATDEMREGKTHGLLNFRNFNGK